jgi:hypothetical protein
MDFIVIIDFITFCTNKSHIALVKKLFLGLSMECSHLVDVLTGGSIAMFNFLRLSTIYHGRTNISTSFIWAIILSKFPELD